MRTNLIHTRLLGNAFYKTGIHSTRKSANSGLFTKVKSFLLSPLKQGNNRRLSRKNRKLTRLHLRTLLLYQSSPVFKFYLPSRYKGFRSPYLRKKSHLKFSLPKHLRRIAHTKTVINMLRQDRRRYFSLRSRFRNSKTNNVVLGGLFHSHTQLNVTQTKHGDVGYPDKTLRHQSRPKTQVGNLD